MKTVTVKCVNCGKERVIKEGEISADDYPMCDDCYVPMIVFSASDGVK